MKAVLKPKSLPWLARRAGVPDLVADRLWNKALLLVGLKNSQAPESRRQAEAMQVLLRMLGVSGGMPGFAPGKPALARAAVCQ